MALTLTIRAPDDAHLHLRDGTSLMYTVAASAKSFKRAVVMPNLVPPITCVDTAHAYRERIQQACPPSSSFTPLMTLYLTDQTTPEIIDAAAASKHILAIKLYPAGATTNAHAGVTRLDLLMPVLERMAEHQLPLLMHGEVTDPDVDIFDREAVFIERVLQPLRQAIPELPLVMEHITTADAVAFCQAQAGRFAATVTPHHLIYQRNDMLVGGIRPHLYCLPILKRRVDQDALVRAVISGDPRFFLGTDSAPHARHSKESACGCAGVFNAPVAMEVYTHVFEEHNALDRLENFCSRYAAEFYQLPCNTDTLTLVREPWIVPGQMDYGNQDTLIPMLAGQQLNWKVHHG